MTGKVPKKKRRCVDILKAFLKFARVDIFQEVLLQLEMTIDTSKYSWQYITSCPIYFLKLSNEISTLQRYEKAAIHFPKSDNNDHVIRQERKKKICQTMLQLHCFSGRVDASYTQHSYVLLS